MSTPNPALVAAAPELVAALTAIQTFITNLGTDPTQVPAKFPGAAQVFLGTVELQLPALATAEFGVAASLATSQIAKWIAQVNAAVAPPVKS